MQMLIESWGRGGGGGECYGPALNRKISGAKFNVTPSF